MRRFEALDSWRGLCALLVVVYHLNQDLLWQLKDAAFLENFDLFVDFFFVLSGFVIASAYEDRLRDGYGIIPFALRRFARIYPLHLAMLAAMLALALAKALAPLGQVKLEQMFDGGLYDASAIFTNLLLLQGVGFENHLTWNYPSWSISAEFFTYLVFALIWGYAGRLSQAMVWGLALACPLLLAAFPSESLSAMTLVRCVYGFALGVLVRDLHGRAAKLRVNTDIATLAEIVAVGGCGRFIAISGGELWLAPLVFACVVLVFSFEAGRLSAVLRTKPFTRLGTLSYSIYMVHAVLILAAWPVVTAIERATGLALTAPGADAGRLWATAPWIGDLVMLGALAGVVAVSALTYALIEKPGRAWGVEASRRWRGGGWEALLAVRNAAR